MYFALSGLSGFHQPLLTRVTCCERLELPPSPFARLAVSGPLGESGDLLVSVNRLLD